MSDARSASFVRRADRSQRGCWQQQIASDGAGERFWPQWRGPHATGVSRHADSARRMERDEERPVEGGNPRTWLFVARRVGRSPVSCSPQCRLASMGPALSPVAFDDAAARCASLHRPRHRSTDRSRHVGAHCPRGAAAGTVDEGWNVGVELGDHRRQSRLCVLRIERAVCVQHGRHPALAETLRGQTDVCARSASQAALRFCTAIAWSSSGIIRGSRSSWRSTPGPVRSSGARSRDEVDSWATPLVVTHEGRAQVVTAAEKRLRSYDLETGDIVWESNGLDDESRFRRRSSDGGLVFAMSGFKGNRLSAIRLADAKGDISGGKADRVDSRPRHALRAFAAALRRLAVFPQEQRRHPVGLRREHGPAALSGAATQRDSRGVTPRQWPRRVVCTSPDVTVPPLVHPPRAQRSKCWRETRSTMASMRRQRWSTGTST